MNAVAVVRVVLPGLAELNQGLQVADFEAPIGIAARGALDEAGDSKELPTVALDVPGLGHHPDDLALDDAAKLQPLS